MARKLTDIELIEISLVDKAAGSNSSFVFFKQDTGEVGFEKFIKIYSAAKANKDERLVYGVVYEPDVEDADGDSASALEIQKAAHQFLEKIQTFKINHKGQPANVKVLESYLAQNNVTIGKRTIAKGSWVIAVRVLSEEIWKKVKDGSLTGFSMAGRASTKEVTKAESEAASWPSILQREDLGKQAPLPKEDMDSEHQQKVLESVLGHVHQDPDEPDEDEESEGE